MPEVLTRQDRVRQIKKRIHILKPKPEKARKGLFFARLLQDGSIRTWGHIAEGGAVLNSLKLRIVPDVIIGYVDEKKVARFKGVILDYLGIETFLRVDERFWRWPFKASGIAHGEYHRKVAENWWRDEAPPIIADFLKDLKRDIYKAWDRRGEMDTRQAQSIINRKNLEIILKLKRAFKDETPTYLLNEPGARRAQLAAGPIHSYQNFQIAALVNIKFAYLRQQIREIQRIVAAEPDGIYGQKTRNAVKDLQEALGVPENKADGLWDEATEAAHGKAAKKEEKEKVRQEPFGKEGKWKLGRGGDFEKPKQVAFIAQKGATLSSLVREMNNFLKAKGIDDEYNVGKWREWIVEREVDPDTELPDLIHIGDILWVKGPIVNAIKERVEEVIGKWQRAIKATHIGTTADGLHKQGAFGAWTDYDWFVALPSTTAKGLWVELKIGAKGGVVPVGDIGPWNGGVQVHKVTGKKVNTDDPYWVTGRRPQAESGRDKAGRKTNKAGIDISTPLFRALKLSGQPKIDWRIVPKPEDGQPYIVMKGEVIKHKNRPWVFRR